MKLTQEVVEAWITQATGEFHYSEVMDRQVDRTLYPALRTILARCKDKGLISPVGKRDGMWRKVDSGMEELAWWDSKPIVEDIVSLPLGLNNYCVIPRPSVILVAGLWQAGKSTFCANVVALNQTKWADHMDLYVSEADYLVQTRFKHLGVTCPPTFKTYTRSENFADVLKENSLSVIDYLRADMEQTYAVAQKIIEITQVTVKNNGVTVIAMQKPKGRALAFGGDSTAWEPTLYIALETTGDRMGCAQFVKIKIPRDYGGYDPYKVRMDYRIEYGARFVDIRERLEND